MKPLRVCNISGAAARLAQRLPDNPGGIPVRIGWDGQQIAVFAGTYRAPTKSLPHARIVIPIGVQVDEIETMLALEVANLQRSLPGALNHGRVQRTPQRQHRWRRDSIDPRRYGE